MTDLNDPRPDSQENQEQAPATPPQTGTPLKSPPAIKINAPSAETMWTEIVIAINYLTRLNLKLKDQPKARFVRKAMLWFPLVGAAIGVFGSTVDWVMTQIGLPGIITAAFAVISMLWATRALHEEEFASMANQYGRSFDKEQGIGWLKEERSVQYGTIAVILGIIIKIGAIASLSDNDVVFQALVAAACWSRTMMVVMASWLRPIPGDPVADYFQQPPAVRMLLSLGLGGLVIFAVLGEYAGYVIGIGGAAGLLIALLGANHLRGYNGPLMGTLQEIVEITVLGIILSLQ